MSEIVKCWGILLFCAVLLFLAGDAAAHELYEIGTARVSELKISKGRIAVVYTVHFGAVVAFNERRGMDEDGDGRISEQEQGSYLSRMGTELKEGLILRVDEERMALSTVHQTAEMGEDRIGPLPFEMSFEFAADLPDLRDVEHEMSFADQNYLDDPNDPEVSVEASGEIKILDSSQWWHSKRYTFDPWAPREDRRTVRILFKAGNSAAPASVGSDEAQATEQISSGAKSKLMDFLRQPKLSPRFILFAMAISIFLGAAHALEPGHGKTIVAAYLIGSRGTVWNAVFLGVIVTITHTGSIILLGLTTLFASQYILPQRIFPWLGFVSGFIIVAVGIWLLVRSLRPSPVHVHSHGPLGTHTHGEEEHHHHDEEHHEDHEHPHASPVSWGSLLTLGISGGLVPCPAALVILLSAIALNRIVLGLTLIVSFSFGLAAVLITIGILMVVARSFMDRFGVKGGLIQKLPIVSATVIIILGFVIAIKSLISGGILVVNL